MEDATLAEQEQKNSIQNLLDSANKRHLRQGKNRSRISERADRHEPHKKQPVNKPKTTLDMILEKPRVVQSLSLNTNPTHKLQACWVVREVSKGGIGLLDNLDQ